MARIAVPAIGTLIADKYRVEAVLGEGGMGVVLLAEHVELGRRVAVKVLSPEGAYGELIQRFRREARAVASLESEHVARVLDFGQLSRDRGLPYVVMELLDGRDLSQEIAARGPMPIDDVVKYALEACEALAEAHGRGIVHRDIKPANLFLAKRSGKISLKVLDFGLAKTTGDDGVITNTKQFFGSPGYMAPEQMRSAKLVDRRTDIWGLGATLYEALSGKPPFMAATFPELCRTVIQDAEPRLEMLRPEIPPALAAAIHRCLEKDPAARFADVSELASALESFRKDGAASVARIRAHLAAKPLPVEEPPASSEDFPGALAASHGPDMARTTVDHPTSRIAWLVGGAVVGVALVSIAVFALFGRAQSIQPAVAAAPSPPAIEPAAPRPTATSIATAPPVAATAPPAAVDAAAPAASEKAAPSKPRGKTARPSPVDSRL